jgi:hypothetical protein
LGLEKLNGEVIVGNEAVMKLHKKFLFQEEGVRRSNVVKDGVRVGVQLIGLTKEEWLAGRDKVLEQVGRAFERFHVSIEWQPPEEKAPHPIDQIEAARARNNLNWMSILRLALEKSPGAAKPIVAEIRRIDQEISALGEKLADLRA